MSLTSFLKNKDVKEMFAKEFKKPRIKINGDIKAPPITTHYSLVGTAFDYLMRFYLKYNDPQAKDWRWVAELAAISAVNREAQMSKEGYDDPEKIPSGVPFKLIGGMYYPINLELPDETNFEDTKSLIRETDDEWILCERNKALATKAKKIIYYSKKVYIEYLSSGIINDRIITASILLAQLDPIFRAGYIDENIGVVDKGDVKDLKNLISLVPLNDFKAKSICLLNPTFGDASGLVGGADADLLIDNQLIDIKTTKKCDISRDMFNQIIGYYILGKIGSIGKRNFDISNVNEIGFYFSRYGIKYLYKVDEIIDENKLPSFIDWFKNRAKDEFNPIK